MTNIIAIASPPGGGKTTLLETLARHLQRVSVISYDDYQAVTAKSMSEIVGWLDSGGALDFIEVPLLVEHLCQLKSGKSVHNPVTGERIRPEHIILFETPLGRAHRSTGQYIDALLWLEVPLDLALSRKVRSFVQEFLRTSSSKDLGDEMRWLERYLEHYQLGTHRALMLQREQVRSYRVDCQLDGTLGIDELTKQAVAWIDTLA